MKDVTLMVVNCRSINNKIEEFGALLETYQPDIVVATETWLDESVLDSELAVSGYTIHRRDRNRHGGGVMVVLGVGVKGVL